MKKKFILSLSILIIAFSSCLKTDYMNNTASNNLKKGREFLEKNKSKEGVITDPSGFQYKILASGKEGGNSPKISDEVKCHYEGWLIDGTVFDSSYKRNEPAIFPVSGVITGWTLALQMMKVGDIWELYLPCEFAYGLRGAGRDIGPNETLIFKVELIEINPKTKTK